MLEGYLTKTKPTKSVQFLKTAKIVQVLYGSQVVSA